MSVYQGVDVFFAVPVAATTMCQAGYRWFQLANRADSRRGQVMSQKRAQDDEMHGGVLVVLL